MLTDLWRLLTSPQARKAQIAIIAFVAAAASAGLFPPAVAVWVNIAVSALTVAGVYAIPNTDKPILEPKHSAGSFRGDVKG